MRRVFVWVGAICALGAAAQADVLEIDLAGWQADGPFLSPNNSRLTINLPVGTAIDNAEYVDLVYVAQAPSWMSELIISLNDSEEFLSYWDTPIVGATGYSGTHGPVTASFHDHPQAFGGPFTLTTGQLYIEVYDTWGDTVVDQVVMSGTLRITYTVPAPGAMALLGGAGLLAARRHRA